MPAIGTLKLTNKSSKDQTQLVIAYSGILDHVTCEQFGNVSWGDGIIELTNGAVAKGASVSICWRDLQAKGPMWKRFMWTESMALFARDVGDAAVSMDRMAGSV